MQPGLKLDDDGLALRLSDRQPLGGRQAEDLPLDREDGVDAQNRFQGQGIDGLRLLAPGLLVGGGLDIGELEELASGVRPTARFQDRPCWTAGLVEIAIAAIGVGLQDARPGRQMSDGMGAPPIP